MLQVTIVDAEGLWYTHSVLPGCHIGFSVKVQLQKKRPLEIGKYLHVHP
jgi:hypothetical protein